MTDASRLRVSDVERDAAAADLRDHFAAGRITSDELSDRLDGVYAAQTAAELDRLGVDLPALRPVRTSDPRREVARRRLYQEAGGIVLADISCVGIWAATGADGSFWPVWVILFSALRIGRDGWQLFGPAAELEAGPVGADDGSPGGRLGGGAGGRSPGGPDDGGRGGRRHRRRRRY